MSEVIELETISYKPLRKFLDKWAEHKAKLNGGSGGKR